MHYLGEKFCYDDFSVKIMHDCTLLFKIVHSTRFKPHQKISALEPALFMFVCLLDLNTVCINENIESMLNFAKFSLVTRLDAKKIRL